ncbi:MAG TPA: hypothetical protein VGB83_11090 [Actinomycetota bacterium]
MIPLPQILAELIMALGAALFGSSVLALLRPRFGKGSQGAPSAPAARGRVFVNAFIGLVVLGWGFASFVTGNGV